MEVGSLGKAQWLVNHWTLKELVDLSEVELYPDVYNIYLKEFIIFVSGTKKDPGTGILNFSYDSLS